MSVKSPRAYAAYARDVPTGGGPACSGSAPDSRPLRARVAVRLRLLVRLGELPHHLLAPLVQSLEPPLLSFGERVRGEDRKTDGVIEVAHDRARELVGIDLPPAHGFGRRGPGQAGRSRELGEGRSRQAPGHGRVRSEEPTSELQSL